MGCNGCSSARGCGSTGSGCGSCSSGSCNKLNVYNWLNHIELPGGQEKFDVVEVRFKNSRKDFFKNEHKLDFVVGNPVAVQTEQGYDVGTVSLVGELVKKQMKRRGLSPETDTLKKIFRHARKSDIEKWEEVQQLEIDTMYKARTIAVELDLKMKISDVEYQADKSKCTFYYTAEERVDFRELIKKLAGTFKVRIEMKQIGMRQEASRLGGLGSCGRELCCSTWLTDFRSVSTAAARYQQLSLNPAKLAGQCGKLKCCLNFELDAYTDALKEFPKNSIKLKTKKGNGVFQKMDIFKRRVWYTYEQEPFQFIELTLDRVHEIIEMNKKDKFPEDLKSFAVVEVVEKEPEYANVVGQDSLTRFDKPKKKKNNRNRKGDNKKRFNKRKGKPQKT